MNKIFNIKYVINKIIHNRTILNYSYKNTGTIKFSDRYDGYKFHDFMDKLSNEGAF